MQWTKNHTKMATGIITAIAAAATLLLHECETDAAPPIDPEHTQADTLLVTDHDSPFEISDTLK